LNAKNYINDKWSDDDLKDVQWNCGAIIPGKEYLIGEDIWDDVDNFASKYDRRFHAVLWICVSRKSLLACEPYTHSMDKQGKHDKFEMQKKRCMQELGMIK
jgi:hypothetical protein